jgi:type II secretory ATPase GspE/PulE/Tfp pilus assembly ATPase PilB-like protein
VFTTVHANNVVDVLGRFLNMGVEPYNFVSALNCILAQRLVRTICEFCMHTVHTTTTRCWCNSGLDPESGAASNSARARAASSAAAPAIADERRSTSCWI